MHPAGPQRLTERFGDMILTLDLGKSGRPVATVECQRCVRSARPSRIPMASGLTGAGDFACHDLILGREGEGPLAHPPEPAYPCCLPALGELTG